VMLGIEMLNKNKNHARVGRKIADELGKSFDSARGGADGSDQQVVLAFRTRGILFLGRIACIITPGRFRFHLLSKSPERLGIHPAGGERVVKSRYARNNGISTA